MGVRTTAVVEQKPVNELRVGDKVLTDVIGYKNKVLIYANTVLSVQHIEFIKKCMGRKAPKLASEKYLTGEKAKVAIRDGKGKVLVAPGKVITREALAPLLKEGFAENETMAPDEILFARKQEFKGGETDILKLNPAVKIETTKLVEDEPAAAGPRK